MSIIDFWTPLYSAIGASIVGHGIVYYLLGRYPVSIVTPLLLPTPIIATFLGVLFFGDVLGWKMILGGAMTHRSIDARETAAKRPYSQLNRLKV